MGRTSQEISSCFEAGAGCISLFEKLPTRTEKKMWLSHSLVAGESWLRQPENKEEPEMKEFVLS